MTDLMIQSISALAVVLALFAVVVWLLRWAQMRTGVQGVSPIRIRRRAMVDSKHSLIEVEYHGKLLLLGVSPNGMQTLAHESVSSEHTNHGDSNQ